MKRWLILWVYLAGAIALAGVAIHLGAILGGPAWYAYFGAPPVVVESARSGTLLAPISAASIAGAMAICAAYAFSAAGSIQPLPLLRLVLAIIATICLLRALILAPLAILHPELRNTFEVVAAMVWGLAGVGFALGLAVATRRPVTGNR
ncbi:MAG: hypothetical protein JNN30_13830 [Rhodanobacteraceae bacterium]|nr:hypothetical protein [Rhodanobacteraceae bacterium]